MTPIKKVFEAFYDLDLESFLEFMVNNEKTLLREDQEEIVDAVGYGYWKGIESKGIDIDESARNYYEKMAGQ